MSKYRLSRVFTILLILMVSLGCVVYADEINENAGGEQTRTESDGLRAREELDLFGDEKAQRGEMKELLLKIFNNEAYSGYNIESGIRMATPIVNVVMTLSVAFVIVACYFFFGQTGLDLFFIITPMARGFLLAKKEGADSRGGNRIAYVVSDTAVAAVGGDSRGTTGSFGGGGSGDRSKTNAFLKYGSSRSLELVCFFFFVMILFTGMIGNVVTFVFNLLFYVFQGFTTMF